MFTSIDKALAAMVMAALFLVNYFFGINVGWITQDMVASILAVITPLIVYRVPNKKPA